MSGAALDASIAIVAMVGAAAVFSAMAEFAAQAPAFRRYRLRTPDRELIPAGKKRAAVAVSGLLSLAIYLVPLFLAGERLVHGGGAGLLSTLGQALAVLVLYDLMYYAAHRAMHLKPLMRLMHGVHHKVRFPTAFESAYLHPLDTLVGVGLLIVSAAILGPVPVAAFLIAAAVHSFVNIVTHTNLVFPHALFRLTNHWAIRHDMHHGKHLDSNYASIFTFLDRLFGTYR